MKVKLCTIVAEMVSQKIKLTSINMTLLKKRRLVTKAKVFVSKNSAITKNRLVINLDFFSGQDVDILYTKLLYS